MNSRGRSGRSDAISAVAAGTGAREQVACELCLRESLRLTEHHLVPRAEGGRFGPKVTLCPTCHGQLHALFSTATLARELNSVEDIRANPQMANYLRWVRKQQQTANFRVRRAANRR